MKSYKYILIICFGFFLNFHLWGQEKEASMTLSFEKADTNYVCKVQVSSENKPVAEIAVKLYVQRLYGLLPIGKEVTTDENGVAIFDFPKNIPLNSEGKLIVLAKVEDDENYGSFETQGETKWGAQPDLLKLAHSERSISASRGQAPIYFIVASIVIIAGIWGTLLYVVLQVFKLKRYKLTSKKI
ncbi:MAG: hypothetical protein Q8M15_12520 [Bacteroidota bacterium]|nr:hypothetical protein [Bacteroidota bacterium]